MPKYTPQMRMRITTLQSVDGTPRISEMLALMIVVYNIGLFPCNWSRALDRGILE